MYMNSSGEYVNKQTEKSVSMDPFVYIHLLGAS